MLYWIAPVIVLGLVVFVHEFGHFLAAKLFGVYAPRFSLGWGKPLLRWRRPGTETEYVISMLPIGGYVRMASRADETSAVLEGGNETLKEGAELDPHWDPNAMIPHGPLPVPNNRWFESKPTYARVVILLAGVTMNAVLSIVVATGIFAGYGIHDAPTVLDTLVAGKPAAQAGLQRGDSVIAVDGAPVASWTQLVAKVSTRAGLPTRFEVGRGAARLNVTITPVAVEQQNPKTGKTETVGKIGAGFVVDEKRSVRVPLPFGEAVVNGWNATWRMAGSVVGVLGGLFRGTVSVKTLGGPIAIARTSVEAARTGMESLLTLIAFLSINLAVLNLLPVPILDGGQVLITIAEGVKGRALSDRTKENLMRVGLVAIGLLFITVMFNDIKGIFS
jgi:regulator of sigma E protease